MKTLFCFGLGYSALSTARMISKAGWQIRGTVRSAGKAQALKPEGIDAVVFDGTGPGAEVAAKLAGCDAVLVSIAPGEDGDPALIHHGTDIAATKPKALIYLSTVGVYGNHDGAWVDEETPVAPRSERSIRRAAAEQAWLDFGAEHDLPVMVFRLSGIYGPGRSPFDKLRAGTARRIVKPGQMFNRIHVDDIAGAVFAGLRRPRAGVYNITDKEPAPPQDVVAHAAHLLGVPPPPEVAFEDAELSPMGRSFYGENKRVACAKAQRMLPWRLRYPTFRDGLEALLEAETASAN